MNNLLPLLALWALPLTTCQLVGQPQIRTEPADQSVSLNATVQLRVIALSSGGPATFQWWFNDAAIDPSANPTASRNPLILSNVTAAAAGAYRVVVSDDHGSTTSLPAQLTVNPTFRKITEGVLVTDKESSVAASSCDYDNDGLPDLLVLNYWWPNRQRLSLYHNEGAGRFTKVTNAVTAALDLHGDVVWADFDNDGDPDLFVPHLNRPNSLFRNDGQGVFLALNCALTRTAGRHISAAWADIDSDGWLDLFVTTLDDGGGSPGTLRDLLYRNNREDFEPLEAATAGAAVADSASTGWPSWCDFDTDGDMDLYVGNRDGTSFLYQNDGTGWFDRVTLGSLPPSGPSEGVCWADVDNDGCFDAYVFGYIGEVQRLHRFVIAALNPPSGCFEDATDAAGLTPGGSAWGPAFGDYDNDGDLDLFVPDYHAANAFYDNNGDGTFTRRDVGGPITEGVRDEGALWLDFDDDGFLDLFVPCGEANPSANLLYQNNLPAMGNTNHWLKVKVEGTISNRQGIGAKVRVRSTIDGRPVWQLREIASNNAFAGGAEFLPHFGLGDATQAEVVRIEWPSGTVQEWRNVASKQVLTVTEPPRLHALGEGRVRVQCWKGQTFEVEASSDLTGWTSLGVFTNESGTLEVSDPDAGRYPCRYYRARGG